MTATQARDLQSPPPRGPGVSIVVSNHNYGRFLARSVASALRQTHADTEVIVVDDGSTDESVAILRGLEGAHPQLIALRKPNGGQGSAINRGFERSTGEWLLFLDSDDVLEPHAVERLLAARESDTAVLQFYMGTVDAEDRPTGLHPFSHIAESGRVFAQIAASGAFRFMPTSANLIRRQALEPVLPMPEADWRICADTYLLFTAPLRGAVKTVPEILGHYRIHGANGWYEVEESPEKRRAIARNHVAALRALTRLVRAPDLALYDDYTAASLVRRIAILLALYGRSAFSQDERRTVVRDLLDTLGRLDIEAGERFLHMLLVRLSTRVSARSSALANAALRPQTPTAPLLRRIAGLASGRRSAWLLGTPLPAEIPELPFGQKLLFGRGGEAQRLFWFGFGQTENWKSWATAELAGLAFRAPTGADLDLTLEVEPYLAAPHLAGQRLEVFAAGAKILQTTLVGRRQLSLRIPAGAINEDGQVRLVLAMPDAAVPALVDPASEATRLTSIALLSLTARRPAARKARPALVLGESRWHGRGLEALLRAGWDPYASPDGARMVRRAATIAFALPNPAMDRFAAILEFERVADDVAGDWRVRAEWPDVSRDEIDLRSCGSLILIVPRGKAPPGGEVDISLEAASLLPPDGAGRRPPGPRLRSIRLVRMDRHSGPSAIFRPAQTLDFSAEGSGRKYCLSGWHEPDTVGVCANDTRAVLGGYWFHGERPIFLRLRVSTPSNLGPLSRQRIRLFAGGVLLAEHTVGGAVDILAIAPPEVMEGSYLRLVLETVFVAAPADFASDGDPRPVAFRLEELVLETLDHPAIANARRDVDQPA